MWEAACRRILNLGRPQAGSYIVIASLASAALAQQTPPTDRFDPQQLALAITEMAEKPFPTASDFQGLAEATLELAQSAMQQPEPKPLNPNAILDALEAVDIGEKLSPLQADWKTLREELLKLLEPPPEDEQDQEQQGQDGDNSDQQQDKKDGQDGDDSKNQENQDQQKSEDGQDSKDQQKQDGSEQDPSESEQDNEGKSDSQESNPEDKPAPQGEKIGDMDKAEGQPEPEAEPQEQPAEPQQTQQVGGTKDKKEPLNARQAMNLQKLEQVKQNDDPGSLFMRLQQAEEPQQTDDKNKTPKKDW